MSRIACIMAAIGFSASLVPVGVYAADAFAPQDVFALPDHRAIDTRCDDARKFADKAAMGTDGIGVAEAIGGERAFLACLKEPTASPDPDHQRYLALAAAASLYLAGTKASGDGAVRLFKVADSIAAQLGGATPDQTLGAVKIVTNSASNSENNGRLTNSTEDQSTNASNASGGSPPGPPHDLSVTKRDPLGGGTAQSYSGLAGRLRVGVAAELSALGAESRAAAPAASPSIKP